MPQAVEGSATSYSQELPNQTRARTSCHARAVRRYLHFQQIDAHIKEHHLGRVAVAGMFSRVFATALSALVCLCTHVSSANEAHFGWVKGCLHDAEDNKIGEKFEFSSWDIEATDLVVKLKLQLIKDKYPLFFLIMRTGFDPRFGFNLSVTDNSETILWSGNMFVPTDNKCDPADGHYTCSNNRNIEPEGMAAFRAGSQLTIAGRTRGEALPFSIKVPLKGFREWSESTVCMDWDEIRSMEDQVIKDAGVVPDSELRFFR